MAQIQVAPRLLLLIVNREQLNEIGDLYESEYSHLHYICLGHGLPDTEVMEMLGFGQTDKAVVFSFVPHFQVREFMEHAVYKLRLMQQGQGIAFTVRISGVSSPIMQLIEDMSFNSPENEACEEAADIEIRYTLIVVALNPELSEKAIAAAKNAGAGEGALLHAKAFGHERDTSVFGIYISAEKEILFFLAPIENKDIIIQRIGEACGEDNTKHMILSLPVEHLAGYNFDR